ncbi:hypothetical protein VTL71DRAFT_8971 [Oculimacula yallundae]|uniref:Uncharacterized protein n=1 Tax=Oculimacula yallundae TaxID=86028 RepID=A0ABR4BV36_9HELO
MVPLSRLWGRIWGLGASREAEPVSKVIWIHIPLPRPGSWSDHLGQQLVVLVVSTGFSLPSVTLALLSGGVYGNKKGVKN